MCKAPVWVVSFLLLFQLACTKDEGDVTGVAGPEGKQATKSPDGTETVVETEMTLGEAARSGNAEQVALCLRSGSDVNSIDEHGFTALHFSAGRGDLDIARRLVDAGADVNASDGIGRLTPLHMAAAQGQADLAELLIAKGADVNAPASEDPPGNLTTPLQEASRRGNVDVVELLISKGADLDQRDKFSQTALHCAANAKVAALLIEANAQMDAQDRSQFTPLKLAIIESRNDVVELLKSKGATE